MSVEREDPSPASALGLQPSRATAVVAGARCGLSLLASLLWPHEGHRDEQRADHLRIRRKLELRMGTVLEFDEDAECLKASKCVDADRMRSVIGIAKKELAGKSVAEWVETLRGPAELPPSRRRRR